MYYIKIRRLSFGMRGLQYWDYTIFSGKRGIADSSKEWGTEGGAVRAAKKVATDLGIEYRG